MTEAPAPFFSVVIPTYNMARWLPDAIESVLNQTFSDFEILIQDNASTDDTGELMGKYRDPRIFYERNKTNVGLFQNVNLVCARAKGRYIKVLCADDMLSPVCLQAIYSILKDEGFRYKLLSVDTTGDENLVDLSPDVQGANKIIIDQNNLFEFLRHLDSWGGGLPCLCVEKKFFSSNGFLGEADISKDFSRDVISWLYLTLKSPALLLDKKLVYVRVHPGQNRYKLCYINQLREMFCFFENCQTLGYNSLPFFEQGRKAYLNDHVVRHYWYGLKALCSGSGFAYLRNVRTLQKQYLYKGFSLAMAFKKAFFRLRQLLATLFLS